jgi:SAM-dependent methyltransferase
MQNPLPTPDVLRKSYEVEYAPYRPAWKENGRPLWKILRDLTTARRIRRLKKFTKGHNLLEVGCGAGDFLYAARHEGWRVATVEYNEKLVETLRTELSIDARAGELRHGLWEPDSFDVIVLWSVIEHVPDPNETLITASSYLRSGGTLLLQFPTANGVERGKFFKRYWATLDLPRHINFFNRDSLSTVCAKAGMELKLYKTSFLDVGWCYLASCCNYAGAAKGKAQKFLRLAMLVPLVVLALPYMALQPWRGRGTEAWAIVVKP